MVWFDGTIAQAIAECHKTGKIFTVFVHGDDEDSNKMIQTWDEEDVKSLVSQDCIPLKFQSGSESCTQFSQIYPIVLLPITYLIGSNGVPLEIVGGYVTSEALIEKIQSAKQKMATKSTIPAQAPTATSSTQELPQTFAQTPITSTSLPGFSDDDTPLTSTASQSTSSMSSSPSDAQQKEAARLQEIIQRRRAEKVKKEEKVADMKEIERRKMGKNAQATKEKHQDLLRRKELEERRRDEKRDKEARNRVLEQIEQDRANKNAAFAKERQKRKEQEEKERSEEERKKQEMESALAVEKAKIARIQFRLPNGSKILRQYERETTLRTVIDDLQSQDVQLPPAFQLVTGNPPRVFVEEDEKKTMKELDLCPSAALIVKPLAIKSNESLLAQLIGLLMFLIYLPMQLVSFLFGSSNRETTERSQTSSTNSSSNSQSKDDKSKKEGKTHRLADLKKKDDDQATWNGNSTQQM